VLDSNGAIVLPLNHKVVLGSPYISNKVFSSHLASIINECAMTLHMFVIKNNNENKI
jgi:hypothetical protein